jgi:hypothetical protein
MSVIYKVEMSPTKLVLICLFPMSEFIQDRAVDLIHSNVYLFIVVKIHKLTTIEDASLLIGSSGIKCINGISHISLHFRAAEKYISLYYQR